MNKIYLLKNEHINLLKHLFHNYNGSNYTTAQDLSNFFDVSVRTIKTYIKEINDLYDNLILSSRNGYLINCIEDTSRIINSYYDYEEIPQNSNSRMKSMLIKLLIKEEFINIDILANSFGISYDTLKNEINSVRTLLTEYDLHLKIKDNFISIEGPNYNKKKLISSIIYEESDESFLSLEYLQRYLPTYDLIKLKSIVTKILNNHKYYMDDLSLFNFILHLAIILERNEKYNVEPTKKETINIPIKIKNICEEIAIRVKDTYGIKLTNNELYDLNLLMFTRVKSINYSQSKDHDIQNIVNEDIINLVNIILEKIHQGFGIKLFDEDFHFRFTVHISNLLLRLENNLKLKNPQLKNIKNNHIFIYEISVYIAQIILEQTGLKMSDDEMAYISLYVGTQLEEQKVIKNKVRVLFYHPNYFYNSEKIILKNLEKFKNSIFIVGVISTEDEILQFNNDYDLLITTVDLYKYPPKNVIKITVPLSIEGKEYILENISSILLNKKKQKLESNLKLFFKEELFISNQSLKEQNDVIDSLCKLLEKNGYTDNNFINKIYEREKLSASSYRNVSLPHPLHPCALETAVAVSVHKKPIKWGNNNVKLVFMLAIAPDDNLYFTEIFEFVSKVISNPKKVNILVNSASFDDFIKSLLSFI